VTLIRAGAIGAKRGGDPFKNLTPTGRWIGGVGITLNTTPDPDQISAWADQTGRSPSRPFLQPTSGSQPQAELWQAPDLYVPRFVGAETGERRMASLTLETLLSDSAFTLMAVIRPGAGMPSAASVVRRSAAVFGEGNGVMSLVCYRTAGQSYVRGHASNVLTPEIAIADDAKCFVAMRLSVGTLTLFHSAAPSSPPTTQSVGSVPNLSTLLAELRIGSTANGTNFRTIDAAFFDCASFNTGLDNDTVAACSKYLLTVYS